MKQVIGLLLLLLSALSVFGQGTDRVYSGETLGKLHPTNLWEALKLAEPSLTEWEEELYGSDPNRVPTAADLTGSTRWQGASQTAPLFILDHARVDARRIFDLDIREVAEVIVHKSPAACARYGIKGSGGVIEVRTVRPEAGSIRLAYTFDGSLQRADLHAYDLMDAAEKLQLEKQAGLYRSELPEAQKALQQLLAEREAVAAQGKSTDWLRVPLQTAFTHRHSLGVSGGDEFVRYRLTLRATPGSEGVMKGSKRDLYSGNAYVEYRYRSLTLSNHIVVDKLHSEASPFGSFDYYTRINPYYTGKDSQGFLYNKLGEGSFNEQINPLYETSLSSFNKMESLHLWDNFRAAYAFCRQFRLTGNFAFTRNHSKQEVYTSPESALCEEENAYKGSYSILRKNTLGYEGNLAMEYADTCGRSAFGGSIGMNIYRDENEFDSYAGIGIPIDRMAYISFATSYEFGAPFAGKSHERLLSGTGNVWYDYDSRYALHATVRVDKSSQLAPRKRRAVFYSAGVQWNLHEEAFLSGSRIVDRLSLAAAFGTSGDIAFSEDMWHLMYANNIGDEYIPNYYLIGNRMLSLTNPTLKWSTTQHKSLTLQAEARGIVLRLNYYDNLTRDLPIVSPTPLATGFEHRPDNGGRIRNYGIEYSLAATLPTKCEELHLQFFTNGIHRRNKITDVPEYFHDRYNREQEENGCPPQLLNEGKSTYELYATRTGEEGWIAAGSMLPKLRGNIGIDARWRGWSCHLLADFTAGGRFYNETLADAATGNPAYNADRRALDPSIRTEGETDAFNERFIEKKNEISLGSLRIGYDFHRDIAERLRMKQLGVAVTANRLFTAGSADYRQGMRYPFARTVTFSLKATF